MAWYVICKMLLVIHVTCILLFCLPEAGVNYYLRGGACPSPEAVNCPMGAIYDALSNGFRGGAPAPAAPQVDPYPNATPSYGGYANPAAPAAPSYNTVSGKQTLTEYVIIVIMICISMHDVYRHTHVRKCASSDASCLIIE